ncbi:SoxR reducing system RseC family protein [Vibrio palustris]|uniref:SoxR reducing system protein RseC n=1 Tax=Vibrio palustris TaxID=1918946 RepID=A0A1R4B8S1_9VIBR|nr:SoxR reducing system RseC family protein [Vibrio palustris]SJL85241.1 SoxR reducing system protein RseC [Vibrio palustris]
MMTALATVKGVQSDSGEYHIQLSCEQKTSCSSCASKKSCGTGLVSNVVKSKALLWHLTTKKSVQAGQVVEIGFPEKSLLQSAALVYIVPLLMMMLGTAIGQHWVAPLLGTGEGALIVCAFIFMALGIYLAKFLSPQLEKRSQQEVVLLRVLGEPIV